jgi:hypothetical protein
MKRHLEEKSLEGMSIILSVRWMLLAPIVFGVVVVADIAVSALRPEFDTTPFYQRYLFPLMGVSLLALVVRDIWIVRRAALSWEDSRIRSLTVMRRLPVLLLFLVPVFIFADSPQSTGTVIEWISGMLWVFSFLSVIFYLVYFVLLLSICKLPKPSAIMGFLFALFATGSGFKERIEEANKAAHPTAGNVLL